MSSDRVPAMTSDRAQTPQRLSPLERLPAWDQIRLVATDVDGTLTVNGRLSAGTLGALAQLQQAGLTVVLITGRSAGWVQGLGTYLPVDGAIAENGGVLMQTGSDPLQLLCSLNAPDLHTHRQGLAQVFSQICSGLPGFPHLEESSDNRFRLTDWTFDQPAPEGFSQTDLQRMAQICARQGYGFTYSSVQCHIQPLGCTKGSSLRQVLDRKREWRCPPEQVMTVGDSPNDQSLFDPEHFPHSVGVANVLDYQDQLSPLPRYVTSEREGQGFQQLVRILLAQRGDAI